MAITTSDVMKHIIAGKDAIKDKASGLGTASKSAFDNLTDLSDKFPDATPGQQKALRVGAKTVAGAALFIGATSILDAAMDKHSKNEAEFGVRQQMKDLEEKEREKKKRAGEYSTGVRFGQTPDMGKVVFEMFEERTGHHRMGNNKFRR